MACSLVKAGENTLRAAREEREHGRSAPPLPAASTTNCCIRSEEPPKNRARFLGSIGQSSWRYLPDYTRHLWPIKDELGTATWLVKGRPDGPRRDNIAPYRRVYRTRISPPAAGNRASLSWPIEPA